MKKLFCILLTAALTLSGFPAMPASAAEGQAPDYTTGTPWPDIDLEGVVTADTPAELKDNYALYVNKDDILSLEIPEGYPATGTMYDVEFNVINDLKEMFVSGEPKSHDAKLAFDLFHLMLDWDSRNEIGMAPLKEMTDVLEAIDSIDALTSYFTDIPYEEQLASLFRCGMTTDLNDSNRYILYLGVSGLLLQDSAEYSKLTEYGAVLKEAYSDLASKMLCKLGYSEEEATQKIDNCFALETMLAPAIFTVEESGSPDYISRINNHYNREEFLTAQKNLPVLDVLEKAEGFPEADDYLILQPDYVEKLNEVYTEENLTLLKDYLIVQGAIGMSGFLDRECYEWNYACSSIISGSQGMLDDETVFSSNVSSLLNWAVARLYTETYLKQEDKDRISAMIDEILDEYHGILNEADFLSDETKARAIEKLEAIDKRVLYPDSWEKYEYEGLDFASAEDGGTFWDAILKISIYDLKKSVKNYSEPVDKEKWLFTPQTVNCFYNPQDNTISILGAFAQGNLYNSDMSDEELYAKLGVVIGHEISHAFDSTGAQFDKDGNMASWWTEEDYNAFLAKNEKLAAYYNNMHPWEGQDFYGSILTNEACADFAGFKCMLRIAAQKEGFDYDAFFRAYANIWLIKESLQMAYMLINDNHPMSYLRINGTLQQFDEFLDFYDIKEGDGMYLAPEDRVTIW